MGTSLAPVSIEVVDSPMKFGETSSTVLFFRPRDRCTYAPSIYQRARGARDS